MINIKVLNTKLVKPCIPTPPNLKNYKLSFLDEFLPPMDVGVLLFYARMHEQILLEESLAKVLVRFYPLAGRFVLKDQTIDCSDQGAEFVQARAPDVDLASLVVERNLENIRGFLPCKNQPINVSTYPILSIQITQLKCDGVVIGICVSHKIFDTASVATFLAAWSNASNSEVADDVAVAINPSFNTSSLFPGKNTNSKFNVPAHFSGFIVKRFSFHEEAIARLRSSLRAPTASRVRVVSAIIAKALISLDQAKHGRYRKCLVTISLNMRERTIPPQHKHACGNLILLSIAETKPDEGLGVQELGDLIGEATNRSISECGEILSLGEDERCAKLTNPFKRMATTTEANGAYFTDWSKFGFYEADFGSGKPVWASIAPQPGRNITVLMGNKQGNGIEAWVHLDQGDMALFEQNEEIRMFAT